MFSDIGLYHYCSTAKLLIRRAAVSWHRTLLNKLQFVLTENLIFAQLVRKVSWFCRTQKFVTEIKRASHQTLPESVESCTYLHIFL